MSTAATRVEWSAAERCCGFGGLFSMKLPEVSVTMADDKLVVARRATSRRRRERRQLVPACTCVAEPRTRAAPIKTAPSRPGARRRARRAGAVTGHTLVGTTLRERTAEATAERAAARRRWRGPPTGSATIASPHSTRSKGRRAASAARAHQGRRGLLDCPSVLEQFADNVIALGGHVYWAADGADANAYIAVGRAAHRRADGREVEVDGDRGDRPQRGARSSRLPRRRDRPRRVDHPARAPHAEPHHRPGRPPRPLPGRRDPAGRR